MRKARAARRSKNIVLRVAVVALSVYMVVSLGITASEIAAKEKELAELEKQTVVVAEVNTALEEQKENTQSYLEQEARQQGMVKPGESVFIEIAND